MIVRDFDVERRNVVSMRGKGGPQTKAIDIRGIASALAIKAIIQISIDSSSAGPLEESGRTLQMAEINHRPKQLAVQSDRPPSLTDRRQTEVHIELTIGLMIVLNDEVEDVREEIIRKPVDLCERVGVCAEREDIGLCLGDFVEEPGTGILGWQGTELAMIEGEAGIWRRRGRASIVRDVEQELERG